MLSLFAERPVAVADAFDWYDNRTLNSLLDRGLLFSAWRRDNYHSGRVGLTQAGVEALREAGMRTRVLKAAREFADYADRSQRR
jgi:hypothetical protein